MDPSSVSPSKQINRPTIPIIVEPVETGPIVMQLLSGQGISSGCEPTTTDVQLNPVSNDLAESSSRESTAIISTILDDAYARPDPADLSPEPALLTNAPSNQSQVQRSMNVAWDGLGGSLRFLKDSPSVFPQLSSAVASLLSCLDGLEAAVQYRQDFENLATELTALSESLKEHKDVSLSMLASGSTTSVAMAIEEQTIAIKEELVRHYRQVQSYFRQLQVDERKHEHMEHCERALSERVMHALHPLRSVLHQSEETGLLSTLHASFPDFMFSNERSGTYFYDVVEHSQLLARRFLLVMKEQLRFNICNLDSSFIPDEEVEDIQERISANISPTLAYACRYWASHLALAYHSDTLLGLLNEFLCHRLLFWMEVLSLKREMPMGVEGLLKVQQWLMHAVPSPSELVLCVDEARSFVTSFAVSPTSQSTPHIYISSLPFFPHSSSVYGHYGKRSRGLLELKGSLMEAREAEPLVAWKCGFRILSLALSPDGTRIAVGCSNTMVRIISMCDGPTVLEPLQGHTESVDSVEFSPDGGRVVSLSRRGIIVWNAYNGTLITGPFMVRHVGFMLTISFSPDGNRLVSGGQDCVVRVWDACDGTPLFEFDPLASHRGRIRCAKFSPNGSLIATPCADHTIQLWNSLDGTLVGLPFEGHTSFVDCLTFTPDGTRLLSGSDDKTVRIWNQSDGSLATSLLEGHRGSVQSVAVSLDCKRVASSSFYDLHVWNIDDGTLVAGPFPGSSDLNTLAYSPDGTRLIYSSRDRVVVRVVRDGLFPPPPPPRPPPDVMIGIKCVSFQPDGTHFLTSNRSKALRIWNTTDGSFITSQHKAEPIPSPFSTLSPDGSCKASTQASETGTLQIISMTDGSLVAGPFQVEPDSLATLPFSRNNIAIIMGSPDGTIQVCDLQSGNTVVGSFVAHHKRVSSISESPDCSLLVSHSDYEMAIRVWNIVAPALDIPFSSTSIDPASGHSFAVVYDGWGIREDG
ncbi:unnamed protein product [Rhizoctonia solani]|uniref:Vegetative incompatibility protein HET-E-1 n=1 Tax=Rhizoctonia solani TaxID=456999 RepID=A0A8H3HS34_9AGAM|nr:unnamed protein product [Rhizoctonia solani]